MVRSQLSTLRDRLVSLRSSLLGTSVVAAASGEPTENAEHPAEVASETFERSKDLSILLGVEAGLVDVERATARLASGSYGICEACGKPIDPRRLEVLPAARFCTKDQSRVERNLGRASMGSGYGYLALAE
ncbi:MAG: TraR/DksA family transcriptional regulator [Actinomycetota bacterium]